MAIEKTKHAFVDDNPYLVYSGEPESTLDNAGGGGGGGDDSPFLYVTVDEDFGSWSTDPTALTINESYETIVNALQAGKEVIFVVKHNTQGASWRYLAKINGYAPDFSTLFAIFNNQFASSDFATIHFYLIGLNKYNGATGQELRQN